MSQGIPNDREFILLSLVFSSRTGLEIADEYEAFTKKTIASGTLYNAMHRMKKRGWVTSEDRTDADGRLRLFEITSAGRVAYFAAMAAAEAREARMKELREVFKIPMPQPERARRAR